MEEQNHSNEGSELETMSFKVFKIFLASTIIYRSWKLFTHKLSSELNYKFQ